jgi:hypothetical protein
MKKKYTKKYKLKKLNIKIIKIYILIAFLQKKKIIFIININVI